MHEYVTLHQIEQDAAFERQKAFWEASEESAYRRAGTIAAMILNVNRSDAEDTFFEAADIFPHLNAKDGKKASRARLIPDTVPPEERANYERIHALADANGELSTERTVDYLKRGLGLLVPAHMRSRVGLSD